MAAMFLNDIIELLAPQEIKEEEEKLREEEAEPNLVERINSKRTTNEDQKILKDFFVRKNSIQKRKEDWFYKNIVRVDEY